MPFADNHDFLVIPKPTYHNLVAKETIESNRLMQNLNQLSKGISDKASRRHLNAKKADKKQEYLQIPSKKTLVTPFPIRQVMKLMSDREELKIASVQVELESVPEPIMDVALPSVDVIPQEPEIEPIPLIETENVADPVEEKANDPNKQPKHNIDSTNPQPEPLYILDDHSAFSRTHWLTQSLRLKTKSIYSLRYFTQCLSTQ